MKAERSQQVNQKSYTSMKILAVNPIFKQSDTFLSALSNISLSSQNGIDKDISQKANMNENQPDVNDDNSFNQVQNSEQKTYLVNNQEQKQPSDATNLEPQIKQYTQQTHKQYYSQQMHKQYNSQLMHKQQPQLMPKNEPQLMHKQNGDQSSSSLSLQQQMNKEEYGVKSQQLQFMDGDSMKEHQRERNCQQNDMRSKSIIYLQNKQKKNVLKQMNTMSQSSLIHRFQNKPLFSFKKVCKNRSNQYTLQDTDNDDNKNYSDGNAFNSQSIIERRKQNSMKGDENINCEEIHLCIDNQKENANCLENNKAAPKTPLIYNNNPQNVKNISNEYFPTPFPPPPPLKLQLYKIKRHGLDDKSNTERLISQRQRSYKKLSLTEYHQEYYQDNHIHHQLQKNKANSQSQKKKMNHQSDPYHYPIEQKKLGDNTPLKKYDSAKFENKLRQKHNLQILDYEENQERLSVYAIQNSMNSQTHKSQLRRTQKNINRIQSPYQIQMNDCGGGGGDKFTNQLCYQHHQNSLNNTTHFPQFFVNSSQQSIHQDEQKISRWEEGNPTENQTKLTQKISSLQIDDQIDTFNCYFEDRQDTVKWNSMQQANRLSQIRATQQMNASFEKGFGQKINKHLRRNKYHENIKNNSIYTKRFPSKEQLKSIENKPLSMTSRQQDNENEQKINITNSKSFVLNQLKLFSKSSNMTSNCQKDQNGDQERKSKLINDSLSSSSSKNKTNKTKSCIPKQNNQQILPSVLVNEEYDIESYIHEQRHIK